MQILLNNELTIRHHLSLSAKKAKSAAYVCLLSATAKTLCKPVRYAKNYPIIQIDKRVILNFKIFNDIKFN